MAITDPIAFVVAHLNADVDIAAEVRGRITSDVTDSPPVYPNVVLHLISTVGFSDEDLHPDSPGWVTSRVQIDVTAVNPNGRVKANDLARKIKASLLAFSGVLDSFEVDSIHSQLGLRGVFLEDSDGTNGRFLCSQDIGIIHIEGET